MVIICVSKRQINGMWVKIVREKQPDGDGNDDYHIENVKTG